MKGQVIYGKSACLRTVGCLCFAHALGPLEGSGESSFSSLTATSEALDPSRFTEGWRGHWYW